MNRFLKNHNGISLVQVTIAMGLVGMLSVVLMKLTENMQKTQKYTEVKSVEIELFSRVASYLNIQSMCDAAVIGIRPGESFKVLQFNEDGNGTRLIVGEPIPGSNLTVENLEILPNPPKVGEDGLYEVTLRVTTKRNDGNYLMAGSTKNKDFTFVANLCEQEIGVIETSDEWQEQSEACENRLSDPDVTQFFFTPDQGDFSPGDGFQCSLCGPTKIISRCGA